MAEALYIISRSVLGGAETLINGIFAVVTNQSDGASAATRAAAAAAACEAATGSHYPATYFDTEQLITTASGALGDPGDTFVLSPNGVAKLKVEGA